MKTLKRLKTKSPNDYEYVRVTDQEATNYIHRGWAYCGKEEWKQATRDVSQSEVKESKPKSSKKLTRSEKRNIKNKVA